MLRFLNPIKRNFCIVNNAYNVLGLNKNCSDKEIHEAYIKKSNDHFKNINKGNIDIIESSDYLKDLMSAYATLSVEGERLKFESYKENLNKYMDSTELNEYETEYNRLAKIVQKKYNIDNYGRIKGGLPNKEDLLRGGAIGRIGEFHDIELQKQVSGFDHQIELNISNQTTNEYAAFKLDDKASSQRKVWYTAKIEEDFYNYGKNENSIAFIKYCIAFLIIFGYYSTKLFQRRIKKIVDKIPTNIKLNTDIQVGKYNVRISDKGVAKLI